MNYIDLFAGAGGLSEGFIRAEFVPIAHVEMDEAACFTLKTRIAYHYLVKSEDTYEIYKSYLRGEISRNKLYSFIPPELLETVINLPIGGKSNPIIHRRINKLLRGREVDLIIGGPPCQAYSLVGRARSETNMVGDRRNYLYIQYAKYLKRYNPKMFVFENVIGLKSAKDGAYLENMKKLFFKKGYTMKLYDVKASDFGVLQSRKRVIILGWKHNADFKVPDIKSTKTIFNVDVSSVLDDLPKIQAGEGLDKYVNYINETNKYLDQNHIRNGIDILTQHVARPHTEQDKEIYRIAISKWDKEKARLDYNDLPEKLKTHGNRKSFLDRFKVVAKNVPFSHTVVAHIAKDGHYYIHPDIEQNRSITVREAARLQSFPDDYYFEGVKEGRNRTAAFRQIGNAVPPLMAEEIAKKIKELVL